MLVLGVVLYFIESNVFLFIVVNGYMNKVSVNISFVIYNVWIAICMARRAIPMIAFPQVRTI